MLHAPCLLMREFERKPATVAGAFMAGGGESKPAVAHDITRLLQAWGSEDGSALERLIPLVYEELHRLAHHYRAREELGQPDSPRGNSFFPRQPPSSRSPKMDFLD